MEFEVVDVRLVVDGKRRKVRLAEVTKLLNTKDDPVYEGDVRYKIGRRRRTRSFKFTASAELDGTPYLLPTRGRDAYYLVQYGKQMLLRKV